MHKYATATALAITLITMLTLAVSAPLTPANASHGMPYFYCDTGNICMRKCEIELWSTAKLWDSTRNPEGSCPPLLQACMTTCVKAKGAARRQSH
jgi:hypothetical protein